MYWPPVERAVKRPCSGSGAQLEMSVRAIGNVTPWPIPINIRDTRIDQNPGRKGSARVRRTAEPSPTPKIEVAEKYDSIRAAGSWETE